MRIYSLCLVALLTVFIKAHAQKRYPSNTWSQITVDCKVGFISPSGKIMIQPKFEHVSNFSNGLAFAWSYVKHSDAMKNIPLGEEYKQYDILSNSLTGIIDSTGTYIVQPKLNFSVVRFFQDGIAYVKIDNEVKIINKKGELIPFTDRKYDREYNSILRAARDRNGSGAIFMNAYSRIVYDGFEACEEFSGNYAAVKLAGKTGYINRSGDLVIVPQFSEGNAFVNGYATVTLTYADAENRNIKYYGVIDTLGNYVIPPKYAWLDDYHEGLFIYNVFDSGGLKSGYLDVNGNVVIPAQYRLAYGFSEGLANVQVDGKYGYINKKGEMVIEPVYSWARPFKSGVSIVTTADEWGLINTSGKFVYGPVKRSGDCH
jgi:hypothetical protein